MSARSERAASPSPCACTNISLMQLFHELKQKFPAVPDHVVSNTIELYCHDKNACEAHLHSEAKASLTHAYHASSIAAARQLNELKVNAPLKCPNQLILKHEQNPMVIKSIACQVPQTAILSLSSVGNFEDDDKPKLTTDANQNVVNETDETNRNNNTSPVTVINIDNCIAKYTAESPSDIELTNESDKERALPNNREIELAKEVDQPESTNYRIHKSNKIKCNLHEKLEKNKDKKTIKKEEPTQVESKSPDITQKAPISEPELKESSLQPAQNVEKPKRPNTLEFLKPNPDIAFKPTLNEPEAQNCSSVSPAQVPKKEPSKETTPGGSYWPERGYPLNVSVNVNCHMDLARGYDPWLEDYDSPRTITSVNLTVCTPTSNMASPVMDGREDDGGFEGHVTVTVSPSTVRPPPRRRAPPPPQVSQPLETLRSTRGTAEPTLERSLIERQKERLGRLATALAQEKGRLAQLNRETKILAAPPASPAAAKQLRDYVRVLRDQCDSLVKRLELTGNEPEASNFYSNIYTGQRCAEAQRPSRPAPPPPEEAASWQCHVCTFRNHGLLDKCEECEMPRILVGTSPTRQLDSGFGSFRDRERRPQIGTLETYGAEAPGRPAGRACV